MKKILVIEDNLEIRENTAEILQLSNYQVFTAENGKQGVEVALSTQPDLIVCDIMMPQLDGYGVLNMVHNNPNLRNTPFIFLSAKTEKGDMRKGMQLGADDYIPKPFDTTDLLDAVERRLKKAEQLKQDITSGLEGVNNLLNIASGKEAISDFIKDRRINKYKKKQLIYTEGNHPSHLYYLEKGKVKLFKTNEEGKELIVSLSNEGDFFGHIALLEGATYKVSAEAIEDSEIAVIPKQEFEELINSNPEVAKKFIKLLANDVTEKELQLLNIAYNSLRKKVADALISFQEKFQKNDGESFVIDISRENLATVAGTATESLIRTLSDFRNEKLIDIKDGKITIVDINKLKRLIN
jgi:CRP-like cAMP-binding protein/CheY-like chemotaxis protein